MALKDPENIFMIEILTSGLEFYFRFFENFVMGLIDIKIATTNQDQIT